MKIKAILGIILIIVLTTCRNVNKTEEKPDQVNKETLGFEQIEDMKEIYYRFPSPDEMLHFIDLEKLKFDDQILLPVNHSKRYLDSRSQAINLGVYIADLAYITLFQRQKEALIYFQVIYGLSDKLRITSAFDPKLLKRFEDNLKNVDSLKALADQAMNDITNYLVEEQKEKTFAIMSIGGYIESLYLAFQLAGTFDEGNPIIQRISDQKLVLENLVNYAAYFADDPNVSEAIRVLHPIRSVYNELIVTSDVTKVVKDKSGKLIVSGGEKITISEVQFNKLKNITYKTRKSITENLDN